LEVRPPSRAGEVWDHTPDLPHASPRLHAVPDFWLHPHSSAFPL